MDWVHLLHRHTEALASSHMDRRGLPGLDLLRNLQFLGLDALKSHGGEGLVSLETQLQDRLRLRKNNVEAQSGVSTTQDCQNTTQPHETCRSEMVAEHGWIGYLCEEAVRTASSCNVMIAQAHSHKRDMEVAHSETCVYIYIYIDTGKFQTYLVSLTNTSKMTA